MPAASNMKIQINVGPLTSFNNLVYHLGPRFKQIREAYIEGHTPEILLDFSEARPKAVSVATLTALLSVCKKLRDYVGSPINAFMPWNPILQSFFQDIGFFEWSNKFSIFNWTGDPIGGYQSMPPNPTNKILYYGDILPIRNIDVSEIGKIKAQHKQKISPNFVLRCAKIFEDFDSRLQNIITNTTLELIVNSLMHGEETAFVGIQRTSKRITVSVCDAGIGFPKSLSRTFAEFSNKQLSHIEALIVGSLVQKKEHGLRLAINEVLNFDESSLFNDQNDGWAIISSYNAELRWQKSNWKKAVKAFSTYQIGAPIDVSAILGEPLKQYTDISRIYEGYWKSYPDFLVGTRITFEIPINFK